MGTCFLILLLLLNMSYGMVWGVLFLVYSGREIKSATYSSTCDTIISWNRGLYILQFISSGLNLISTIFQLISAGCKIESNIPKYIMGCRSCVSYIAGLVILIGINTTYFNHPDMAVCGDLKGLNLAYIISEWTIMGSCCLLVCVVCIFTIILKRRKHDTRGSL